MKISIIVPAYNVEQYIFECLNSVAFQTFNGVIECLVIDDCGQDKSINVAENFIDMYEGKDVNDLTLEQFEKLEKKYL